MAYDYTRAFRNIVDAKKQWTDADAAGNTKAKNQIAANAQAYYNNLKRYGYGDVADKLAGMNYEQAQNYLNGLKTSGKSAIRPYMYEKGKAAGLSESDVDNLISYNDKTGEVSFGGKNIGTPDAIIDGASYWDPNKLDTEWNDYIKRTGANTSGVDNAAYNQLVQSYVDKNDKLDDYIYGNTDALKEKYTKLIDEAYNTPEIGNVTDSEDYKAAFKNIMPYYEDMAAKAGYSQEAYDAANNGGNIDSYAAANARREHNELVNQGLAQAYQMGVDAWKTSKGMQMDAYNSRIGNVRGILSDLGVRLSNTYSDLRDTRDTASKAAQQYFDNAETAKINDYEIKRGISEVTGITPAEWENGNNPLVDDNGVLLPQYENLDFETLINAAEKNGDTQLAKQLKQARYGKALLNPDKYMQFLQNGNFALPGNTPTEAAREYDLQNALEKYQTDVGKEVTLAGYQNEKDINAANNQTEKDINAANNKNNLDQISATQTATGATSGVTAGSTDTTPAGGDIVTDSTGTYQNGVKVGDKNGKPLLSNSEAKKEYEAGNTSEQVTYAYKYYYGEKQMSQLSDEAVAKWAAKLNGEGFSSGATGLTKLFGIVNIKKNSSGGFDYSVPKESKEFVAHRVLASQDLTDEQKIYLLKKFGFTDADADIIHTAATDPHYNK